MTKTVFAPVIASAMAAAVALTSLASPVSAGSPANGVTVSVADLDLRTSQGRNTLDTRLKYAVKRACAPARGPGVREWVKYRDCVDKTTNDVARQRDRLVAQAQSNPSLARTAIGSR